jgi:DNA-binding protein HU-beta
MSKAEFIEKIASKGKMSKAEASRTVDLVFGEIESGLKAARAARMGRNPQTGEPIKIKASKSLRFKPASNLKRAAGC